MEQECNIVKNLSGFPSPCCSIFPMLIEHSRISIRQGCIWEASRYQAHKSPLDTFLSHILTFFLQENCSVNQNTGSVCFTVSKWIGHFFPWGPCLFQGQVEQLFTALLRHCQITWFYSLTTHCIALFSCWRSGHEQVNSLYLSLT